jgi:uncharacterized phage protein (TIGR02220 family)
MHRGYIRLYRKGVDHPLFKKPLVWHFWSYCLLRANYKDREILFKNKPFILKRGSFMMSLKNASRDTGLTIQNIRTALKTLENFGMVKKSTQSLTKQATIISVIKFDEYQKPASDANAETNTVLTQSQHSLNTVLTTDNKVKKVKKLKKKESGNPTPHKEIIEHLNKTCGKNFKPGAKANISLINGRLAEGYTVDDFKAIIDFKNKEWHKDKVFNFKDGTTKKARTYLQPSTLFKPTKFDEYLNEAISSGMGGRNGKDKSKIYAILSKAVSEKTEEAMWKHIKESDKRLYEAARLSTFLFETKSSEFSMIYESYRRG